MIPPLPSLHLAGALLTASLLAACASLPSEPVAQLLRHGQPDAALAAAEQALQQHPGDATLRSLQVRAREQVVQRGLASADLARAAGRWNDADAALRRVLALAPQQPRALVLQSQVSSERAVAEALANAETALREGRPEVAETAVAQVLAASPRHPAALALQQRLQPAVNEEAEVLPEALARAYRQPVTLEFREAPLRSVFEALARSQGLNFVFDKDVRGDTRLTLFLRDVPLDEALRLVLRTQQLDRQVLNANTLLIYPDTAAKQRQHQDLVTRTLYLTNADPKTVLGAIRTIAKTQDVHVDERLNALVVRDAPAIVRRIEALVANLDLPEPEVMLEIEVLEVASSRLDALGLQWPEQVNIGLIGSDVASGSDDPSRIVLSRGLDLRATIANPALVATLRGTDGSTHTLANPSIRARSREKAQVHVGEKLPVFASTAATANVAGTTTVSYIDVGIKLDVQPVVQLDNEVSIKVELEVSDLVREVAGPAGSVGYEIGTRRASTSLRLRDGETQVLAGLLKDEDRRSASGVPGLVNLPLLGKLFGVHSDNRRQTEVVLLITPRVLRNLPLPPPSRASRPGGTAADPGAMPLRLSGAARATVAAGVGAMVSAAASGPEPAAATAGPGTGRLQLASGGRVAPGGTVSVTLRNPTEFSVSGELEYDAALFVNAAAGALQGPRTPFALPPGGEFVLVLRALSSAAPGVSTQVGVTSLSATARDGTTAFVEVDGSAEIQVVPDA